MHIKILVDVNLETTLHFFVVDFVFLAGQLFLLDLDNFLKLRRYIQFRPFVDVFLDTFNLLLHKSFQPLLSYHVLNALLFYAVLNFLICCLIDFVKDL